MKSNFASFLSFSALSVFAVVLPSVAATLSLPLAAAEAGPAGTDTLTPSLSLESFESLDSDAARGKGHETHGQNTRGTRRHKTGDNDTRERTHHLLIQQAWRALAECNQTPAHRTPLRSCGATETAR